MTKKQQIKDLLKEMHPSDAIRLIETIGVELRKANFLRIEKERKNFPHPKIDLRPDEAAMK